LRKGGLGSEIRLSDLHILKGKKMGRRPENFDAMEEAWRRRVENARERYLAAVSQTHEAEKELPAADRGHALEQAHLAEREALAQYLIVLRIFKDLVLKGMIPPEEGSSQSF
jgi:hypothetical protein